MSTFVNFGDYVIKVEYYVYSVCFQHPYDDQWSVKVNVETPKNSTWVMMSYNSEKEAREAHLKLFNEVNSEK